MDQERPWRSDAEFERQGGGPVVVRYRTQPPPQAKPWATFGLLIAFLVVFLLEVILAPIVDASTFYRIFTIQGGASRYDWIHSPWTPLTSMFSHDPAHIGHILFNSLTIFFFGPNIERLVGKTRYLSFFILAGMASGLVQAALDPAPALGASGALMGLIGLTIILLPKSKIILFPIPTPIPIWIGGIIFALLDLVGAFAGHTGIGNFAHLSGMAIGLLYGWTLKQPARRAHHELLGR